MAHPASDGAASESSRGWWWGQACSGVRHSSISQLLLGVGNRIRSGGLASAGPWPHFFVVRGTPLAIAMLSEEALGLSNGVWDAGMGDGVGRSRAGREEGPYME